MKKSSDILRENINEWLHGDTTAFDADARLTEEALIQFAKEHSVSPGSGLKEKILQKIKALEDSAKTRERLSLDRLPMLEPASNWQDWEEVTRGIEPPVNFRSIYLHSLESNEKRELFIAWVREYIDEEVHHDLLESFLILEGTCECHITGVDGTARVVRMSVGDYIEMGIGETHDVIITSLEPAKAILQWRKIA